MLLLLLYSLSYYLFDVAGGCIEGLHWSGCIERVVMEGTHKGDFNGWDGVGVGALEWVRWSGCTGMIGASTAHRG